MLIYASKRGHSESMAVIIIIINIYEYIRFHGWNKPQNEAHFQFSVKVNVKHKICYLNR